MLDTTLFPALVAKTIFIVCNINQNAKLIMASSIKSSDRPSKNKRHR